MKITFLGAGSTIFARNVLGDVMMTPSLQEAELALYDIDANRLEQSRTILEAIQRGIPSSKNRITTYCGEPHRREALRGALFVVNAVQIGGYKPSTVIDFEIPKKYGLRQTIADTLGIGGIMRGLRTLPFLREVAQEMEAVAPHAWFLNYTNPMSILSGYLQRYTQVETVGLCHSVQICSERLLNNLEMEQYLDGRVELIAGINHMGWLLRLEDHKGNDLYPEIRKRIEKKQTIRHNDMVRYEYVRRFGYYCTESSEHNAEYNPYFIKKQYPELIEQYNIPLDEYPKRCEKQISEWQQQYQELADKHIIEHKRSKEYASHIMEARITNTPYTIGGNVLNAGSIENLVPDACVEVPCLIDNSGIHPTVVGNLPTQLAALNSAHIAVHKLTIDAFVTNSKDTLIQAALLDPHTAAELSIDDIVAMTEELLEAHGITLQ
ncbi:alpha-glucosidase/alpha-galactosidase [uncultured Sphaerochaeta sp.]|uniref:alpha-glucosidase/alpha-galactosidase n=1 Tax=uncultured Sphaerochaeta sp. TaxID=886478 RepID=UPI0029C9D3C4|nr:alpha-glucosidase/alpha-galactosidase [uncultured Sphaerochaeta sp.]